MGPMRLRFFRAPRGSWMGPIALIFAKLAQHARHRLSGIRLAKLIEKATSRSTNGLTQVCSLTISGRAKAAVGRRATIAVWNCRHLAKRRSNRSFDDALRTSARFIADLKGQEARLCNVSCLFRRHDMMRGGARD
jgi:hypothetical protein